jgi:hypothetical protein
MAQEDEEREGDVKGADGRLDQAVGKAKDLAEDVRDAAGHLIERAREEIAEHRSAPSDSLGAITALARKVTVGAAHAAPEGSDDPDTMPSDAGDPSGRRPARGGVQSGPRRARTTRTPKTRASVWTIPHGDGWANKREGGTRVAKVFPTKAAAQTAGRATAQRERVEHVIFKRDGAIAERNSYGNVPARRKG